MIERNFAVQTWIKKFGAAVVYLKRPNRPFPSRSGPKPRSEKTTEPKDGAREPDKLQELPLEFPRPLEGGQRFIWA